MPRVLLNKEIMMPQYFSEWVIIQMRRKKTNGAKLAYEMGITRQAFCRKLRENKFTYENFIKIVNYLDATDEDIIKLVKI